MPSDYVAFKTFIKCDPLLVQLLYPSECFTFLSDNFLQMFFFNVVDRKVRFFTNKQ